MRNVPFYIRRYTKEHLPRILHQHEMLQINYVMKGSCHHFINGRGNEVTKGDSSLSHLMFRTSFPARRRTTLRFTRSNF